VKTSIISFVKDVYRVDLTESEWYSMIAKHLAEHMTFADGVMVYSIDASDVDAGVTVEQWAAYGVPNRFVAGTLALNRASTANESRMFYHQGILCGTVSEQLESRPSDNARYGDSVARWGFPDSFGLTASAPTHEGVVVNAPLNEPTTLNARTKAAWRRVGVHLQAGYRLRKALTNTSIQPEAIVRPDGRIAHVEPEAAGADTRERLRLLVQRLDRLQRQGDDQPSGRNALEIWQGLIDGRWSLVESYDSDGRRFFLAYANEYGLQDPRALSRQERTVIALAAQGDSNKWIAYQLGIGESTVATHLRNAMKKLHLRSRSELIWVFRSLSDKKL
jgi:DNA-binding CsgD family transcriptional regulator